MTESKNAIGVIIPERKRVSELAYMNVLFTLFVIFVHILSESVTALEKTSLSFFVVYAPWKLFQFVTQGFIFLSGVKLFLGGREVFQKTGKFYFKRFKRVVLPYIAWVIVYYIYFVNIGYFKFDFSELARYVLNGDLSAQFYFVIIICQFYLLSPLIAKLLDGHSGVLATVYCLFISLILGQYLPQIIALFEPEYYFAYNDRIFTTYIFYFVAGCTVGKNYDKFIKILLGAKGTVYSMFALFAASNLILSYLTVSSRIYIGWCETLHFAYCVSAILFFMTVFASLTSGKSNVPAVIKKVDASSYMLYLSHVLALLMIRRYIVDRIGIQGMGERLIITVLFMLLYTVCAVFAWGYLKNKVRKIHITAFSR